MEVSLSLEKFYSSGCEIDPPENPHVESEPLPFSTAWIMILQLSEPTQHKQCGGYNDKQQTSSMPGGGNEYSSTSGIPSYPTLTSKYQ